MKQSFFILGDKIDIISNNKDLSRKFIIDLNLKDEELISKSEIINYDDSISDGTTIFISNLNKNIVKDINNNYCIYNLIERLGRIYCKFIEKNHLEIYVNDKKFLRKI